MKAVETATSCMGGANIADCCRHLFPLCAHVLKLHGLSLGPLQLLLRAQKGVYNTHKIFRIHIAILLEHDIDGCVCPLASLAHLQPANHILRLGQTVATCRGLLRALAVAPATPPGESSSVCIQQQQQRDHA